MKRSRVVLWYVRERLISSVLLSILATVEECLDLSLAMEMCLELMVSRGERSIWISNGIELPLSSEYFFGTGIVSCSSRPISNWLLDAYNTLDLRWQGEPTSLHRSPDLVWVFSSLMQMVMFERSIMNRGRNMVRNPSMKANTLANLNQSVSVTQETSLPLCSRPLVFIVYE